VAAIPSPPHTLQLQKLSVLFTASTPEAPHSTGKNATTARHLLHRGGPRRADDATTNHTKSNK
jgi:hypothetical protein